jgi:hypothetical protein
VGEIKVVATAPGMILLCEQHESPVVPVSLALSAISYQLSAPLFLLFSILLRVALLLLQTGVVSFAVMLCFAILQDLL